MYPVYILLFGLPCILPKKPCKISGKTGNTVVQIKFQLKIQFTNGETKTTKKNDLPKISDKIKHKIKGEKRKDKATVLWYFSILFSPVTYN